MQLLMWVNPMTCRMNQKFETQEGLKGSNSIDDSKAQRRGLDFRFFKNRMNIWKLFEGIERMRLQAEVQDRIYPFSNIQSRDRGGTSKGF